MLQVRHRETHVSSVYASISSGVYKVTRIHDTFQGKVYLFNNLYIYLNACVLAILSSLFGGISHLFKYTEYQ
jgi:hypothetical protein